MVSYGHVCVKDIETFWSYVDRVSTFLFDYSVVMVSFIVTGMEQ